MQKPQSTLFIEPLAVPAAEPILPYNEHVEVTVGKWDAGLCHCFSFSAVNWCMVWCLPCISLAQVSQRVGYARYWTVLVALLAVWALESLAVTLIWGMTARASYISMNGSTSSVWRESSYELDSESVVLSSVIIVLAGCFTSLTSLSGGAVIGVTWVLRHRVRKLLEIKGNCFFDGLTSVFCTYCAIAQMTTQVKTYRPGSCDFGPVDTLPAYLPQ